MSKTPRSWSARVICRETSMPAGSRCCAEALMNGTTAAALGLPPLFLEVPAAVPPIVRAGNFLTFHFVKGQRPLPAQRNFQTNARRAYAKRTKRLPLKDQ